jgi:hypothetical protein
MRIAGKQSSRLWHESRLIYADKSNPGSYGVLIYKYQIELPPKGKTAFQSSNRYNGAMEADK